MASQSSGSQYDEEGLRALLKEVGLDDTEYWLAELQKEGVKSKTSLEYYKGDQESFEILLKCTRYRVEKKALARLLKMEATSTKTTEIVPMNSKSSGVYSRQKSKSLILPNIHELLKIGFNEKTLQGILLTKNFDDIVTDRKVIIRISNNLTLTSTFEIKQARRLFLSELEELRYKKMMTYLGQDISNTTETPVFGSIMTADLLKHGVDQEDSYVCTVHYTTVEVATCAVEPTDLQLSQEAITELQSILQTFEMHNQLNFHVRESCEQFFKSFGSHATSGPFSFGGHILRMCSCRLNSDFEKERVISLQEKLILLAAKSNLLGANISNKLDIDSVVKEYRDTCSEDTLSSIILSVLPIGGSCDSSDEDSWKTDLKQNITSWILTDRGTQLIAIWDIIKMNHHSKFGALEDILKNSWEKMSELTVIENLKSGIENISEDLYKWNKKDTITLQQFQQKLDDLEKKKSDLLINSSNSSSEWIKNYLSHPEVLEFLYSAFKFSAQSNSNLLVKNKVRNIVSIDEMSQVDDPRAKELREWLYCHIQLKESFNVLNISDFSTFNIFLSNLIEKVRKCAHTDDFEYIQMLTHIVTKAVQKLNECYQDTYDSILIFILIQPFQTSYLNEEIEFKNFTASSLEILRNSFFKQRIEFNRKAEINPVLLQPFLFLLAMEEENTQNTQFKHFIEFLSQRMNMLQPPLSKAVLQCLIEFFASSSLENFKKKLIEIISANINTKSPGFPELNNSFSPTTAKRSSIPKKPANKVQTTLIDKNIFEVEEMHSKDTALHKKINTELVEKSQIHSFFEHIGLGKYKFKKKLQLCDALCIRPDIVQVSLQDQQITDPKQLPFLIIHKLMSYDTQCRSELMTKNTNKKGKKCSDQSDSDDCEDSDNDEITSYSLMSSVNESFISVHPIDALLAVLICSDDFLRQDLFSRLAKCQLSVPFILPDPFTEQFVLSLWAMRTIINDFTSTIVNKIPKKPSKVHKVQKTHCMITYPMPIVSFVRIGSHTRNSPSKSKIMNDVIGDEGCNHFFHRDCPGGHHKSYLKDGLVDMCWYLPAGKSNDIFSDAITFLNLHGDARNHLEQLGLLSQISSIVVVLLLEHDLEFDTQCRDILNQIYSSPSDLTVLNGSDGKPNLRQSFPKLSLINLGNKSAAQTKDTIRSRLRKKLEKITIFQPVDTLVHDFLQGKIVTDESSDSYKKGLQKANHIKKIIMEYKMVEPSVKEAMLPLQGDKLWRAWAYYDKEVHRQTQIGSESIAQYTENIYRKQATIRNQQLKHVEQLSPVMKLFIEVLIQFGNGHLRNYFLQCLKLELNSLSRDNVSDKQQKYHLARKELSKLQTETETGRGELKAKTAALIKELENLQEDIINSSLGLEHLLRELGQIYEAALQSKPHADYYFYSLPKIAAELLIDGYPLELMDGDAAHVPLKWVTAVLKEAIIILQNPNVLVLSVLGLQSTGKSTMLNTAFGLQFNVSAGRCTRGAFMQLLSLDDDLQCKTNCNYVLVVDTEGLRAPELDPLKTQKHDNELATFVIGLANMTLINIYGEVPGDMDDILQTSVHAFLRMNKVKYHPSCQFVHQNAGVNIKGEVGRAKFTQKLNQFTVDAAREEHCEGQYETFNDVIKFDDQTDVYYFPGLWKGDPPMAPVNQGYSHTAQFLKNHLVDIICSRTGKQKIKTQSGVKFGDLSLKSFSIKISDLWETLLKEKFVFSFKNTLEIAAYNSLERAYTKWEWTIQSSMLEWEQKAENEIRTEPSQSVSECVQQKHRELILHVDRNLFKPLQQEMERFFDGKQSEILAQWKSRFEVRLSTLISEVKQHAVRHCDQLLKSREVISDFEKTRNQRAEKIKKSIQKHIEKVKSEQDQLKIALKARQLGEKQLQSLLSKDLFTPNKLKMYVDQKIISFESRGLILDIITRRGRKLDTSGLKNIMENVLNVDQGETILKKSQHTEKELQLIFESIWQDLIKEIPPVKSTTTNIQMEVEKILVNYAATFKGHDGRIIQMIKDRTFVESQKDFNPEKDMHFKCKPGKNPSMLKKIYNKLSCSDPHQQAACQITKTVFEEAEQCILEMTTSNTDFNPALTKKLLRTLEEAITKYKMNEVLISFTPEYYCEIFVRACSHAVPYFEKMARKFEEKNNPIEYLERNVKLPLFTKFKNQYKQTESEEAIADTLCAYLEEPIKLQVQKTLGRKIVNKMKASEHYFSSKMALKVKILTDLYEQNDFNKYMIYVRQVKKCLTEYIRKYTEDYCDEILSKGSTRLQVTAKEEVTRLVTIVRNVVSEINVRKYNIWLQSFSSNTTLRAEIGANIEVDDLDYDCSEELNLESFKQNIYTRLDKLMTKCHTFFNTIMFRSEIDNWEHKPHELLKSLIGCTEQCPFCGEQCDLLEHDPSVHEHRIEIHRLNCLAGWRFLRTKVMATEICPTQIAGDLTFERPDGEFHPFRKYKEVHPQWSIPPDVTSKSCLYWKWFVGKYKKEIAEEFVAIAPDVPDEWSIIQWEQVKENLESSYNVET